MQAVAAEMLEGQVLDAYVGVHGTDVVDGTLVLDGHGASFGEGRGDVHVAGLVEVDVGATHRDGGDLVVKRFGKGVVVGGDGGVLHQQFRNDGVQLFGGFGLGLGASGVRRCFGSRGYQGIQRNCIGIGGYGVNLGSLSLGGEQYVYIGLSALVKVQVGKGAVHHYGVDAELELFEVGFGNAYAHVARPDGLVVGLGDNDAIHADNALHVGGENAVQVALDVHVCGEVALEVLDVHEVVQVGLACRQGEILEAHVHVKIVGGRIDGHLHVQVAAVGELEAHAHVGLLVAQVNGGNGHAKVLDVNLGAHLGVFVDDVAVLEDDVLDGNAHGETVGDFGRVDHAGGIGCGGVGGFCCGRILC